MRTWVPRSFVPVLLALGLTGCRWSTRFDAPGPVFTGADCVPTGTEATVRLLRRPAPGVMQPGSAWAGLVENAVLGANGDVVIPALSVVEGRVETTDSGTAPSFRLSLDWVTTPKGKTPLWGWARGVASTSPFVRATLVARPPPLRGQAKVAPTLVCPWSVEVPAGTLFVIRLNEPLEADKARPGVRFAAVALTPLYSRRGDLVVRVGADVEGEIKRIDRGIAPTLAFRSVDTLLGAAPLFATIEKGTEEAIRLPMPVGAEVSLRLAGPLRVPLPGLPSTGL